MRCSVRAILVPLVCVVVAAACGGCGTPPPSTPTTPTATVTSITVTGAGSPSARDTAQLTATANFSDGTTQTVIGQATWESSNAAVVTVSSSGAATFVAAGEADLKASYKGVSGSAHVTCAPRGAPKYTLSGTITDLKHEYNGSVSGTATGSRVDATEFVNFTIPCPGKTMQIGYSGTK